MSCRFLPQVVDQCRTTGHLPGSDVEEPVVGAPGKTPVFLWLVVDRSFDGYTFFNARTLLHDVLLTLIDVIRFDLLLLLIRR